MQLSTRFDTAVCSKPRQIPQQSSLPPLDEKRPKRAFDKSAIDSRSQERSGDDTAQWVAWNSRSRVVVCNGNLARNCTKAAGRVVVTTQHFGIRKGRLSFQTRRRSHSTLFPGPPSMHSSLSTMQAAAKQVVSTLNENSAHRIRFAPSKNNDTCVEP